MLFLANHIAQVITTIIFIMDLGSAFRPLRNYTKEEV